jgi:hypothetical protein
MELLGGWYCALSTGGMLLVVSLGRQRPLGRCLIDGNTRIGTMSNAIGRGRQTHRMSCEPASGSTIPLQHGTYQHDTLYIRLVSFDRCAPVFDALPATTRVLG